MEVRIETNKDMVTTRKGTPCTGDNIGGKSLDEMNNFLVTSGVLVRPLSNNGAACYDSSSSLMKHWHFMFALSWCDN